ncbi:Uncharacterised protein [Mycobacteroides abscessus subsp. abscessus]|nr:Uncharacterised protein [Mycobacteroides abscessus subsp. abscessus]
MFAVRPPNAEPLLFAPEVKAYSSSDSPWLPGLKIDVPSTCSRTPGMRSDSPVPSSASVGVTRTYSDAKVISRARIFLPRYSGVRPTSSPPMKTVITARTSIP